MLRILEEGAAEAVEIGPEVEADRVAAGAALDDAVALGRIVQRLGVGHQRIERGRHAQAFFLVEVGTVVEERMLGLIGTDMSLPVLASIVFETGSK